MEQHKTPRRTAKQNKRTKITTKNKTQPVTTVSDMIQSCRNYLLIENHNCSGLDTLQQWMATKRAPDENIPAIARRHSNLNKVQNLENQLEALDGNLKGLQLEELVNCKIHHKKVSKVIAKSFAMHFVPKK